jgi:hypothetical protein
VSVTDCTVLGIKRCGDPDSFPGQSVSSFSPIISVTPANHDSNQMLHSRSVQITRHNLGHIKS